MRKVLHSDLLSSFLVMVILGTAYWMTARPGHDWGGDFAQYINHARNLVEGKPYTRTLYEATFPGAVYYMPAIYPPVFPLLLSPVYAHYGLDYAPMKFLTGSILILAVLMTFVIARLRGLPPWLSAAAALAFGSSGLVLGIKDEVISDGTYLLFAGMTLAVAIWIEQNGWDRSRPILAAFIVLIPALLAIGSRAVGLSLALAFGAYFLFKFRIGWYQPLVLLGTLAGGAIASAALYDTRSYRSGFKPDFHIYLHNIFFYLHAPGALWGGSPGAVRYGLAGLTIIVVAFEWVRRTLSDRSLLEFYMAAAIAPAVLYMTPNSRYMLPVLAFYYVYFFEGLQFLLSSFDRRVWVNVAACALFALGGAFNLRGMEKGPYAQGVEQPSFAAVCNFIIRDTAPDSLLISWNPRVLALYTGRPSAWYPSGAGEQALDDYLQSTHAGLVLVYSGDPNDERALAPHMQRDENFTVAFRDADFVLYRRKQLQ